MEEGYLPFIVGEDGHETDVTIHCFLGIPPYDFQKKDLLFDAKNERQKFYSIYRSGTNLAFVIYNQQNIDEIQQIAYFNETYTCWKVYSGSLSDTGICPLKYPLGPIVLYYLTVKTNSVMIHASCTFDGEYGRIFTGFSGSGKSTLSKLCADAGNLIVNDERLIIRKRYDGYYAYNTPMYYSDIPKQAPLDAIYLISHSLENKIKQLSGALAISKVLAFCFQNNFDQVFIKNNLNFISELCSDTPVYKLEFVPDANVISFISSNEKGGIK
jgi:hypothetical protein